MAAVSKPNKALIAQALQQAESLREIDEDHHGLAHALLYFAECNRHLEQVAASAEEYIRFGQDAQLHGKLLKALQAYEQYQREVDKLSDTAFGLD